MTKADLQSVINSLKEQANNKTLDCQHDKDCAAPCWMSHRHHDVSPICAEQVISLTALVAYVAHQTGRSEFRVERDFTDHFCIPNLKCLPIEHYDNAICYMAEQMPAGRC